MDFHEKYAHLLDVEKLADVAAGMPDLHIIEGLAELYKAFCDPTRLKILISLQNAELCVHEIAAAVCISVSAVSHQLRYLKSIHLVKSRKHGKMVYYSLADQHVISLINLGMDHIQEVE